MPIELIPIEESRKVKLILNGFEISKSATEYDPYTDQYFCEIFDEKYAQEIIKLDPAELTVFRKINLNPLLNLESKISLGIELSLKRKYKREDLKEVLILVYLMPNLSLWDNPFTYDEWEQLFLSELDPFKELENLQIRNLKGLDRLERMMMGAGHQIEFAIDADLETQTIADSIAECVDKITRIDSEIYKTLIENASTSIKTQFVFPESIRTHCEQYLLYFAQFLRDLGINATSKIEEEAAGRVLFSVTPSDDKEAIGKIREALALYLDLPSNPMISYDDSIASERLQHEIEKLQYSQRIAERELRLAQRVIEHQDKIVEQKDLIIEQKDALIEKITSKSVMVDSIQNKEELEDIYEGFQVGKSKFLAEQLGLHFNPATFLKGIGKNLLGEKIDESILKLDKLDKEE